MSSASRIFHGYRQASAGAFGRRPLKTVLHDVSLAIPSGSVVGLVGESGSGKSTLARILLGLEIPRSGAVSFKGRPMPRPFSKAWRRSRDKIQMVFQDPYAAMDRRVPVLEQVAEPLVIHGLASWRTARERARETLARVSFPAHHVDSKPGSLSGGQLQRAVIARAVILGPELLICDEPVSSLDVSVQAQVLSLLAELKSRLGMSMLFVSHDLNVVGYISDFFAVLAEGRLVEAGPVGILAGRPAHPYTELLLASSPGSGRPAVPEVPFSRPEPGGCAYYGRCHRRRPECASLAPPAVKAAAASAAACLFPAR